MITVENASALGKRSAQLVRERKQLALLNPPTTPNGVLTVLPTQDFYPQKQISHVRSQIDLLSKELAELLAGEHPLIDPKTGINLGKDYQAIDRVAKALSAMREDERRYANRPLPGKAVASKRVTQNLPPPE